jgi:TolC family type I secretion outer membrane protein
MFRTAKATRAGRTGPIFAALSLFAFAAVFTLGHSDAFAQTFEEALATTYLNNPTLRAARAELRAVDEGVSQALSNWRPNLDVESEAGLQYTDTESEFFSGSGNSRPRGGEMNLIQPVYRGGRTLSETDSAELNVLSQRARLKAVEQDVLGDAIVAYLDVWRDQSILQLNIKNEQVLRRQLEAASDRFEVGEITRTDVAQSESRLARATADRIASEGQLSSSRAVFQRVVGIYPTELTEPAATGEIPQDLKDLIEISVKDDPRVVAALYAVQAARKDVRSVEGELYPSAQLRGRLAYEDDFGTSSTETKRAEVFAELNIPLYQQGAVSSRVRQAKQVASQRRIEVDETRQLAREDSIEAWEALVSARAQIVSLETEVRSQQIALEGVRQENEVGERTILDVLDAEQELLDAQVRLVSANRDQVVASYGVLRAMGRLTALGLELPVELYNPDSHYRRVRNKWFGLDAEAGDQ